MSHSAFLNNLAKITAKYHSLSDRLSQGVMGEEFVKMSKEYSDLTPAVEKIEAYQSALKEHADLTVLAQSTDAEISVMAQEELYTIDATLSQLEHAVKVVLLPKDEADKKNAILEVRAGTGGEEAALFAAVLFNMYQRYAENMGWRFEIMSISDTGIGGYKEASALISGNCVFARLKFESGVHRVQRVPDTESSGRIHTSAATVAVLAEAEEVDVKIDDKDLRIDTYRASGAGGQHVNTTDSAVRVTHIPTGIVVTQQDERSQFKNKSKALKILRSKLYEFERNKIDTERASSRKSQVGSGDRSERIRTYNFPQSRVTDHRINLTLYKIDAIVGAGEMNEVINALIADDEARRLAGDDT